MIYLINIRLCHDASNVLISVLCDIRMPISFGCHANDLGTGNQLHQALHQVHSSKIQISFIVYLSINLLGNIESLPTNHYTESEACSDKLMANMKYFSKCEGKLGVIFQSGVLCGLWTSSLHMHVVLIIN